MKKNMIPDTDIFLNSIKKAYFLFSRQIDGTIISVSPAVTSMLGYDRQEFMQLFADTLLLYPLQKKTHSTEYEIQINHKNGSTCWLKIVETPIVNQAGEIKAFDCMAHDITKHKKVYNELLASEKKTRKALGFSIRALASSVE